MIYHGYCYLGADGNFNPYHNDLPRGVHFNILKVLVGNLVEKNILWKELNLTLLHIAAKDGNIEIVKYLSGPLSDINPSSPTGE